MYCEENIYIILQVRNCDTIVKCNAPHYITRNHVDCVVAERSCTGNENISIILHLRNCDTIVKCNNIGEHTLRFYTPRKTS